ncbi:ABC transporter permease [Larkinella sp. VNQ87]|uniref:ABC transporter permease n=1 Tax=Larkinella sp. VNQ87 TaxID=3400921 RepID=UPI003C0C5770
MQKLTPPRWADRLLELFCAPHLLEEVQGDLYERFLRNGRRFGWPCARRQYGREVLSFLRPRAGGPFFRKQPSNEYSTTYLVQPAMLRNYFKTAWRNLVKNRFYALINMTGLTTGLAVGMLILLWVQDELSFDRFHAKADQIYRLENEVGTGASKQIWTVTVAPIAQMAKREVPEVKDAVRVTDGSIYALYKYQNKTFADEEVMFADPNLFTVFDFGLVKGNPANPFPDDNSVVLTETSAKRYFGDEEPIGKVITTDTKNSLKVTGVIPDFPKNSSIKGDLFLPMSLWFDVAYSSRKDGRNQNNDFHEFGYDTYLLLQPGVSTSALATKLRTIHLRNKSDDTDLTYLLQALPDMHLYKADGSEGGMETVRMFTIIALLILVIACINYVNLSTARSMLRAKEVSMRKIVGAAKTQLFMQFIIETALLFTLSALLAVGLMSLLMPFFNQLSGKQLVIDFSNSHIWSVIGLTITGTLLASSVYPALLLSSFEPLKALKGNVSARLTDAVFRKALVITQFTLTVILISGMLIIGRQLEYIRSKELGYDKNHVFSFFGRDLGRRFDVAKAELLQNPGIVDITRGNNNIVELGSQTGANEWDGKEPGETMMMRPMAIDENFIPFFKMKLPLGANFTGTVSDSSHYILNETAVKTARIQNPIGKRFKLWDREGTIIGVVKDFHFSSMKQKIEPAIFYFNPKHAGRIYIKTTGKDALNAIAAAEQQWKKYNPENPFKYTFLDQTFDNLYKTEQRTATLFTIFTTIAILISCLGLFGLVAYTAQVRTREIGVRKVLGATIPGIIQLLAKDFVKLVLVSILLAVPVAWYAMNQWLQGFAYHITIQWWMFAGAGLLAMTVALLTISFQSIKAALMNPVKSLRSE